MKNNFVRKLRRPYFFLILLCISLFTFDFSYGDEASASMTELYRLYRQCFEAISTKGEITSQGFYIVEEHVFPFLLHNGEEVSFIPAFDSLYSRMAIFIVNKDGKVLYKTDQLETNNQRKGELKQPNKGIAAVSFQDVNGDGLIDLLLITFSENKKGSAGGKTYKVGDVLFQQKSDKQVFYRDYRISNKINQYGMNKSIKFMTSYLAMDYSTEFLYTANTLEELKDKGFEVSTTQSFYEEFEKWGKLQVVSGKYTMAEYYVFMVYLVNEQGYIVWSFQPMKNYESLYELKGIGCEDIDGDGLKDVVVLGSYIFEETDNESVIRSDYSVYYQRSGGFYEDTGVKDQYHCSEEDTLDTVIGKLHKYWGWN